MTIEELKKKKVGYTLTEILEVYQEIIRIKQNPEKYKTKGNLSSRMLWSTVSNIGNIP